MRLADRGGPNNLFQFIVVLVVFQLFVGQSFLVGNVEDLLRLGISFNISRLSFGECSSKCGVCLPIDGVSGIRSMVFKLL